MKKRIMALLLSAIMVLSLAACGDNTGDNNEEKKEAVLSNDIIKVYQYKGLEVTVNAAIEVTEEDIDESIKYTMTVFAKDNTEAVAKEGDVVIIDYVGKIDGEEFSGGSATEQTASIGAGEYIDGFEEGIIGHKVGDVFDVTVTFPDNYTEELAGKEAVFTMTLKGIAPEVTDELVKRASISSTTVEEYREEHRKALESSNQKTYLYELVKKYKNNDIAVVCKTIAPEQLTRLKKLCRVYIHKDQKIICKVAIINWDTSIINYITKDIWKENAKEGEGIYQTIHADYTHPSQGRVPQDDRIKYFIAITEDVKKNFIKLTNRKNVIVCRNPLEIEKDDPVLTLISATRLTEEKGGSLMLKLANKLDELNINYIWFIFTTDEYKNNPVWRNNNIIKMKNRLDVGKFIAKANWLIQPSECEGDSYTLKEALYRGVGIVACELPYFKEYNIEDGKKALFLKLDGSNLEEVANKMKKPLKFTFNPIKDEYDKIIIKGENTYEKDLNTIVKVQCIKEYYDIQLQKFITTKDDPYEANKIRAEYLVDLDLVKIIDE